MDKGLSYFKENISGGWEDENYLFVFNSNKNTVRNHISYTNKKLFPNGGLQGIFMITDEVNHYCLDISFSQDYKKPGDMVLKIQQYFDGTSLKVQLPNNEMLRLTKIN